jgi:hypothetical protein
MDGGSKWKKPKKAEADKRLTSVGRKRKPGKVHERSQLKQETQPREKS